MRRDLFPTAYALLLIPFGVYLASYAPWFASETAIDRHEVGQSIGHTVEFPAARCDSLAVALHGQGLRIPCRADEFRGQLPPVGIQTVGWPMSLRPVLYAIDQQNVPGCGAQSCVKAVMLVGTPAMWWLSVPVLVYACWRTFVRRDWRYAAVLVGYCAGWLPWFADIDRQMYFFYAATMAPFLAMAIALILGDILYKPGQNAERRTPRAHRGVLLCRTGVDELRLAVPGAHRSADLAEHLEHGDLATQLALALRRETDTAANSRYPQPWLLVGVRLTRVLHHRAHGCTDHRQCGAGQRRADTRTTALELPADLSGRLYSEIRRPDRWTMMTIGAWLWSERRSTITGGPPRRCTARSGSTRLSPIELLWRNNHCPPGIIARDERFAPDEVARIARSRRCHARASRLRSSRGTSRGSRRSLTSTLSPAQHE